MTKDKLMLYTFIALLVLVGVSFFSFGITSLIMTAIAVLIAVGIDALIYKTASDSPLNTMSAAVFGLIVALSYTLGLPQMRAGNPEAIPILAPDVYIYIALITTIGMVLFKKVGGLKGRKYVNPAAAAKLLVLIPFISTVLLAKDHLWDPLMLTDPINAKGLGQPTLAGPIGYSVLGNNGLASFSTYLVGSFWNPTTTIPASPTENDVFSLLFLQKFHGWAGGASSLAVIIVGIALFVVARRYIKWRITAAYFASVTLMAVLLHFAYPGGDVLLRLGFELFIGSSIFLAFFMATDPATTPLTYVGQLIFGVGLGVLTVLIQTYMGFFGGSILALVVMNLTSPLLDKVGKQKPMTESKEPKLPRAIQQTQVKTYACIRCGACMRVCCHNLSPIMIKEAFDKMNVEKLIKLNADYCTGCGHCTFVCPARIELKGSVLRAKAMLRNQ